MRMYNVRGDCFNAVCAVFGESAHDQIGGVEIDANAAVKGI